MVFNITCKKCGSMLSYFTPSDGKFLIVCSGCHAPLAEVILNTPGDWVERNETH